MSIRVLVVDDSSFFRRRVAEIISAKPELEVVGYASNGQEAIDEAIKLKPDVITMDIEMPVLDGISAVKKIMAERPTAILMFSALTHDGAKATLDALDAGAADFLPKKFEEVARDRSDAVLMLQQKLIELGRGPKALRSSLSRFSDKPAETSNTNSKITALNLEPSNDLHATQKFAKPDRFSPTTKGSGKKYKLLAIGTSTGGPVALQKILVQFPANFPYPIILVQHMPGAFTPAFAARLDSMCKISVKEASDGEKLHAGTAYLAPGGKQMTLEGSSSSAKIKIFEEHSTRVTYKPSVDISFGSAAKVFAGDVLSVILTGMGADGKEGARMLKQHGAKVWSQDEQTSVVYGMPQAVAAAGISERSLPLERIASEILTEMC